MPLARLRRTLRRYARAAHTCAEGRPSRYPGVVLRMGAARWGDGLGPLPFSLFRLHRKPKAAWRDYVRDTPGNELYDAINPRAARAPLDDKLAFARACRDHGLATVPLLAIVHGPGSEGAFDVPALDAPAALERLLATQPQGLFVKPVAGSHGEGAFRVLPAAHGCVLSGEGPAPLSRAWERCAAGARAHALLVQPRLVNAASMRAWESTPGFSTVRAMTWRDGATPRLLAACLRIATGDSVADNFLQGRAGNLVAPLEGASGTIGPVLGSRSRDWPDIAELPDHPAAGTRLPWWPELLDLVLRGQQAFADLRLIGWDVGITDEGPLLVEGNAAPDWDLPQLAFDRGFRPDLARVLAAA